jgi:hypothetical protein
MSNTIINIDAGDQNADWIKQAKKHPQFEAIKIIAERPRLVRLDCGEMEIIPTEALVFNAPRFLYASRGERCHLSWVGDFVHGVHYAAMLAGDPDSTYCLEENRSLDAKVVLYYTEMQAMAEARKIIMAYLNRTPGAAPQNLQGFIDKHWRTYFDRASKIQVTVNPVNLVVTPIAA